MYTPSYTGQFKRDRKQARKRNWDLAHLDAVVSRLIAGETLEARYRAHALSGKYAGHWECHVEPDFLRMWYYAEGSEIVFVRAGSHADLFRRSARASSVAAPVASR